MAEITIDVQVAGRSYPLKISKQVEDTIRKAAKMVNNKIADNEGKYYARDKQDLLAMTALQISVDHLMTQHKTEQDGAQASEQLTEMESFLSNYLSKEQ